MSEVIMVFLHVIMFANTAALLHSLLWLVSHCFWEGASGEEISIAMVWGRKHQSLTEFLTCSKKPTSRLLISTDLS